jgi:3-deoxy-D-manno-octulosonic-acid transferase
MSALYNLLLFKISVLLKLIAPFNEKIKLFVEGRNQTFSILNDKIKHNDKVIWFHCASLGEFEQGRPVIEKVRNLFPTHKIVLSFFSPSGFEIRKNFDKADAIVYLPIDTVKNAKKFLELIHPQIAIFVKYEFWPNLLNELKKEKIPTILISGILRENQLFFKSYGSWMREKLTAFSHFFVQDQKSKELLDSINFNNVTLSGDTRFDRVYEIVNQDNKLEFLEVFKDSKYTLVAGSTWPDDENFLVDFINNIAKKDEKFIIAPHNINPSEIKKLQSELKVKACLYTNYYLEELKESQVFIIDTIGILTKVYSYADVAYVGGGFTNGIHNLLEPAAYGIPVLMGPKYQKFKEAEDLIDAKACVSVKNKLEFNETLIKMRDELCRKKMGSKAENYIKYNIGATNLIVRYMIKVIENSSY